MLFPIGQDDVHAIYWEKTRSRCEIHSHLSAGVYLQSSMFTAGAVSILTRVLQDFVPYWPLMHHGSNSVWTIA